MKKKIIYALVVSIVALVSACGETAEEISYGMDHELPSYKVLNDSSVVSPLQEVQLEIEVSDKAGLKKVVFAYGDWNLNEVVELEGSPVTYVYKKTITVPQNAVKEWTESVKENDGTIIEVGQTYHKLTLTATDMNMNVKLIPIYIKVI